MNGMQGKILGRIRERIETAGAEFVQVEQWANTGTVYAQHDLDTGWQVETSPGERPGQAGAK